nr:hypothetical protein Itr_chr11CG21280 [Ipomoea trifida]
MHTSGWDLKKSKSRARNTFLKSKFPLPDFTFPLSPTALAFSVMRRSGFIQLVRSSCTRIFVTSMASDFRSFSAACRTSFKESAELRFRLRRGALTGFSGVLELHGSRSGDSISGEGFGFELECSTFFVLNDSSNDGSGAQRIPLQKFTVKPKLPH